MKGQVRKATPQDFPYILDLYMKGLEELGENYLESMCLKKVVLSYHLAPCFLLVDCDNIIGIAGLTTVTSSHNGDATLSDYMFYVLPEHRSLENLSSLVEAAKEFASETDMPLILNFIVKNNHKINERLMRMHGLEVRYIAGIYHE